MTIRAWRIVKTKHAATAFSGDGARMHGGRWSSPGVPMVYVAGSTSLAMLEMMVHLQSHELLKRYVIIETTFDDAMVKKIDPAELPDTWRQSPPPNSIQQIGNLWVADGETAILRAPSAIVPTEWNYLLNPTHRDFKAITIGKPEPFKFDRRFVRR